MKVYNRYNGNLIGEFDISPFVNLSGANLEGVNFCGADLHDANLSGANLSSVNLSGANLSVEINYDENECG